MRRLLAFALPAAALIFLIWGRAADRQPITAPQPTASPDELQAVTLVFGWKDMAPASWDGNITVSKGKIEKLVGHHLTSDSSIDGTSWKLATHAWTPFAGGMHPAITPGGSICQVL